MPDHPITAPPPPNPPPQAGEGFHRPLSRETGEGRGGGVPKRAVIVFAHPALERARIGPALLGAAAELPCVSVRDLYDLYPDTTIDVEAEQAALVAHDLIVLQFPLHWYSVPALLKEWLDLVLQHNWAYGTRGRALDGKSFACAFSAGGRADSYRADGSNRFTIAEFMRPLEQTAVLCRMRWIEPFVVYDAASQHDEALAREAERYRAWIEHEANAAQARTNG